MLQQAQAAELREQAALGLLNLREHVIEGIGQQIELVSTGARRSDGVVLAVGDGARRLREPQDRSRKLLLQPMRQQIGDERGYRDHKGSDHGVKAEAFVDRAQVGFYQQHAQLPVSFGHRHKTQQVCLFKAISGRLWPCRQGAGGQACRIGGEQLPGIVVERGCDDVGIGPEGAQDDTSVFGFVERERCGTVGGNGLTEGVELPHDRLSVGEHVIGEERSGRNEQHDAAGEQIHRHQLAADRGDSGRHGSAASRSFVHDLGRSQEL